ncbi:MAG: M1 family metallopeptidase [Pseudomonadota bacterium]
MVAQSVAQSLIVLSFLSAPANAQSVRQTKGDFEDKFRQLEEALPTPNTYRTASGAPGHEYWQQEASYKIKVELDEANRSINGSQIVSYTNNSPDTLRYLWLQLDQNRFRPDSIAYRSETFRPVDHNDFPSNNPTDPTPSKISIDTLRRQQFLNDIAAGHIIKAVTATNGEPLKYTVVDTLMRVDLAQPIGPGQAVEFGIDWRYQIMPGHPVVAIRSGYEHFPDDARPGGNDVFSIAQWHPRLAVYSDYEGWHSTNFLGRGEFTLEFGDFDVEITVPADHVVAATGTLQNADDILTATQKKRLEQAKTAKQPVFIVTDAEALENEKAGSDQTKTWKFSAKNVRDFAWASSRKFMWDAQGHAQPGSDQPIVMAMSFYPKEGGDLWKKYSTEAIIHTMDVYSRFSFDYPYPTAQSVMAPIGGGMEYPMISFNNPRPTLQKDGSRTYSRTTKDSLIKIVIHEIGHVYFPMIVNSDERQWKWMDEGINTFLHSVAFKEWAGNDLNYSTFIGSEPYTVIPFMTSQDQQPLMTSADSLNQTWHANGYDKPAVALSILRETVLGRDLFDFAFKEYATRWKFKRPTPADFFRTMEEASGVDLDWFWRGWFYSTDHVDISLDRVYQLRLDTEDPDIDFARRRTEFSDKPTSLAILRNAEEGRTLRKDRDPRLKDFYDDNDRFVVTNKNRNDYQAFLDDLSNEDRKAFDRALKEDKNYYVLEFSNVGGLVMPIILGLTFEDGTTDRLTLPAEIWRKSPKHVSKLIVTEKTKVIDQIIIDPDWHTADADIENNYYPRRIVPSRIEAFKNKRIRGRGDIMQEIKTELKSPEVEE